MNEMNQPILQVGGVVYRDIPPQDQTFVVRQFPFTEDIPAFCDFIESQTACGGGDGPEAVASALHEARSLKWITNGGASDNEWCVVPKQQRIVQLAFILDTTASMGACIEQGKHAIVETAKRVKEKCGAAIPSTQSVTAMAEETNEAAHDVTRIMIFITDAPPHGIGVSGDYFVQGEPVWNANAGQLVGYDPMDEMKALCELGITSHFVLDESGSFGKCPLTRSFYNTMASMSQGRAVRLGDASDLIELVSSCAVEARQMDDLTEKVTSMMAKLCEEQPSLEPEQIKEVVYRSLSANAPVITQIRCSELDDDTCIHFRSCTTLEEMRSKSHAVASEARSFRSLSASGTATYRSLSAATATYRSLSAGKCDETPPDEDDNPVFRSTASLGVNKRALAAQDAPVVVPPSPVMRVRSYDAKMTDEQLRRLLARIA